jgi:deoxyribodipyrimidine photolyase
MKIIVWYRGDDLRVSDHEPLISAANGAEVIPALTLDSTRLFDPNWGKGPRRYLLESLE